MDMLRGSILEPKRHHLRVNNLEHHRKMQMTIRLRMYNDSISVSFIDALQRRVEISEYGRYNLGKLIQFRQRLKYEESACWVLKYFDQQFLSNFLTHTCPG